MASEIRANSITSRAGLSTVTMTDSGPMFSGITTFVDNSGFTFGVGGGTSIFTPATNILTLGTNNTEKVRIDANGNANITGVTTAANFKTGVSNLHDVGLTLSGGQIDVGSNIKLGTAGVITATTFHGSGANLTGIDSTQIVTGNTSVQTVDTGSDGHIKVTTEGTERARIDSSGRMGLGTNSPTSYDNEAKNLVVASADHTGITIASTGSSKRNNIYFADGTSGNEKYRGAITYDHNIDDLYVRTAGVERVRIDSSGNSIFKGSGTDVTISPTDGLINFGMDGRTSFVTGTNACYIYSGSGASGDIPAGTLILQSRSNVDRDIVMVTGSTPTERLRIASSGQATFTGHKVRIDGGSTARSIDVETTHASGGEIASFQNNDSGNYGGLVISGGEIDRECRMEAAWGSGFMTFWTDNAERGRFTSDGKLGVNDTGSGWAEKLQVTGNYGNQYAIAAKIGQSSGSLMRFGTTSGVCGSITGNGTSSSFNTSSDYRLKENDVKISDGITRLKQLRPIRFNWKSDSSSTQDGFFAHEVSTIVPESVTGEKDATIDEIGEGYQKIDHSKLVPLLAAALQEAITKVETLEQDNIALRARVTNLEGN